MATGAPSFRLPPGAVARRPPRHSLLLAAQAAQTLSGTVAVPDTIEGDPDATDERWVGGVAFESDPCGGGGIYDPCGGSGEIDPAAAGGAQERDPFVIEVGVECSTLSRGDTPEDNARALRFLNVDQHRQVGLEFWRGTLADADGDINNPALANDVCGTFNDQSTALSVVDALATLDTFLAGELDTSAIGGNLCSPNGLGMIHASPYMVNLWANAALLEMEGGVWRSPAGNIVVTGPGYDGSDPSGTAAGTTEYAYATGLVYVWLGAPVVLNRDRREINRATNLATVWAERAALATWDCCCHLGVKITRADRC